MPKIIEREIIKLSDSQLKMTASGWGSDVIEKTTVEKITYDSDQPAGLPAGKAGGLKVKGYIAYPKDDSKKYPCIIWCRGGIGNAGAIHKFTARGIFGQIACWGYCVFASQYRGNDVVKDMMNLVVMTYLLLTRTDIFKAAVVMGGIANLRCNSDESKFMRRLYEHTMGKYNQKEYFEKCESRSIINFPEKLSKNTPLLILHGNADKRVLPHDSIDLSYKLLDLKYLFRLVMLEGGDHFMKSHRKEVDEMRKNWFEKHLK